MEVRRSSFTMRKWKAFNMQNQGSPRLTTVEQQQNPHSLRGGNRNEPFTFFPWLVCATGHYSQLQSVRDLLRCSSFGSDSHLSRGEGTSPVSLAAHCWLLAQGMQIPDPSRDRCTSCTKLPVKAFLPGAGTAASQGNKDFLSSSGGKPELFMAGNTNWEPN